MIGGQVVAVWRRYLGAQLMVPVAATDSILYVDALEDFEDDGGAVLMSDGRSLTYSAVDYDALTITLTAPAGAAYPVEDGVSPDPPGVTYEADVTLSDDDTDAVVATVPHYLIPLLGEGQADPADPRTVILEETTPGSLVVTDVINREPVVLGSYVDPDDLIPPPTDGLAPASSPTPTVAGGIGALVVTWAGVSNADPVTYEVHAQQAAAGGLALMSGRGDDVVLVGVDMASVNNLPPDPNLSDGPVAAGAEGAVVRAIDATWVGEVAGTSFWIRHLADGTPLVAGVTYEVWLIAKDKDGEAPASAHVQGSPALATDADLAVGSVTADQIVAGAVTAEKLESQLVLGNEIYAGDPDSQHVRLSGAGVELITSDQQPLVTLPTDPAQSAWFRGVIEAVTLEILQGLTMRGVSNVMGPGSILTLMGSLKAPLQAPNVSVGWERQTMGDPATGYRRVAWNATGDGGLGSWFVGIQTHDTDGNNSYTVQELRASDMSVIRTVFPLRWGWLNGLAVAGAHLYVLAQFIYQTWLDKYLLTTGAKVASTDVSSLITVGNNSVAVMETLGNDGATVLLADADPATFNQGAMIYRPRVRTVTMSDTGVVTVTGTTVLVNIDLDAWKPAQGVVAAENRYWILTGQADRFWGSLALPWTKAGAVVADQDFGFPAGAAGLVHDGTRFWSVVGGDLVRHTNWNWTTESSRYWVGATWYENVAPFVSALPAPRRRARRRTSEVTNGNR